MRSKRHFRLSGNFALALVMTFLLPANSAEANTTTSYYLPSVSPTAIIETCRDYTYGLDYEDDYANLTLHSNPVISAPPISLKIEVYFSQSCSRLKDKYVRTLSLIRPDGTLIPLTRDVRQSWSSESKYSVYCYSTSCWGHNDVYLLAAKELTMSGDYGLRFTTNYLGVVCKSTSGASVCESNVPFQKTFDLPKLFTLAQSAVPTPNPTPVPTVSPSPSQENGSDPVLLDKLSLSGFSGKSSSLSNAHKRAIDGMILGNPSTTQIVCTSLNSKSASMAQQVLSKKRAVAACNYALSRNNALQTSITKKVVNTKNLFGGVLVSVKG